MIVRNGYSPEEVNNAQQELEAMTLADDPRCASIYFEGAVRQYLKSASAAGDNRGNEKSMKGLALGFSSDALPEMEATSRARYVRKFMGFTSNHPPLDHLARNPRLVEVLRGLCDGREVELFQEMAMLKPPGGREKPWHQDHAYFNHPLDTRIIGVWIALADVGPENGCMYLLPGGHKRGPIPHFMRRDWQICDSGISGVFAAGRIAAPMKAGDVLIFDSKLPHGTPRNTTNDYRWAVQLHYRSVGSRKCPDEERLAAFGSEGKNVSC